MAIEVIEAKAIGGHRLHLRFSDGCEGDVDLALVVPFGGVFAVLRDPDFFSQVYVDHDWGTVCWPGDLDMAAEPLWERITGRPVAYRAA
jgi:hypothetical protein